MRKEETKEDRIVMEKETIFFAKEHYIWSFRWRTSPTMPTGDNAIFRQSILG